MEFQLIQNITRFIQLGNGGYDYARFGIFPWDDSFNKREGVIKKYNNYNYSSGELVCIHK